MEVAVEVAVVFAELEVYFHLLLLQQQFRLPSSFCHAFDMVARELNELLLQLDT